MTDRTITIVNPTNEQPLQTLSSTSSEELSLVLYRAAEAQKEWASIPPPARSQLLLTWGDLIDRHVDELAHIDTDSMGKVLQESLMECKMASRNVRYWAGMADKLFGDQLADVPGRFSYTVREPLGVFAVILPWNAPAHSFVARCVPALACGNAVVVKPSELSPLSALKLVDLANQAGLPEGLISAIVGAGDLGEELVRSPLVDGVSFTGSVATGRHVAQLASADFKPVTLELGGKNPVVVFEDANLEDAARSALINIYKNAGQICAAGSRLLIQRSIAAQFIQRLKELASQIRVGDPTDDATHVGPVSCRRQYEKVLRLLEKGLDEGATALVGGGREASMAADGFYIAPTILTDVTDQMSVVQEEIFGPVLTVEEFEEETEAISRANETEFGLAAYVWTTDGARMIRVANALEAGAVHVNTPLVLDASLPFGGFKNSGIGNAYGDGAVEGCTQTKRVTIRTESSQLPNVWGFQ